MKRISVLILLFALMMQPAFAQVGNFQINPAQIQTPPECSEVTVTGDKAYLPFSLKVFVDFSRDANITFEQLGSTVPNTHTSPELLIFDATQADEYQVRVDAKYDADKIRAAFIQYFAQGSPNFQEILSYEGTSFCRIFNIRTSEAPKIPTREELLGEEAHTALIEMPLIKNAINSNTIALNASVTWLFIGVVAAIGVAFTMLMLYAVLKRKDKSRISNFDKMISVGSSYVTELRKELDELKKFKKDHEDFLDMATMNLKSYMIDLRDANKLALPKELKDEEEETDTEEQAEETSILRKIYELTSDEHLGKLVNFIGGKKSRMLKWNKDLVDEVIKKRTQTKVEGPPKPQNGNGIPLDKARKIVAELGKERYRSLSDSEMILLYRAYDTLYRDNPTEQFNKRLWKINEIINIRAKEKADKEKKIG